MKRSENKSSTLLTDFEAGRIDPANFPHRAHLQVGFELLRRHPFPEALLHLARGLRGLAARAGRPELYHETITAAFLALIAERRECGSAADEWETFIAQYEDLLGQEALAKFYPPKRLRSEVARRTFILPAFPPWSPRFD